MTLADFVAYLSRWRLALLILAAMAFAGIGLWIAGVFGKPPGVRTHPSVLVVATGWFGVAVLSGANRTLTGGDIAISLTGTDRSFAEALAAVERFRTSSS